MGWKHEGIFIKDPLHERFPGPNGGFQIVATRQVRLRPDHLDRVMEGVSGEIG